MTVLCQRCRRPLSLALSDNGAHLRCPHEYDDDAVCIHCGFDGAEWWALNGMEEPELREPRPECRGAA